MSIFEKVKNLNSVVNRLGSNKFKRAQEIIRTYGMRELLRRTREKMEDGGDPLHALERSYVVINESYHSEKTWHKKFEKKQEVSFVVEPNGVNMSKVDLLTYNEGEDVGARITMRILHKGNLLLEMQADDIKDYGYTTFEFTPILNVVKTPIEFNFRAEDSGCGILVNSKKKYGFSLEGGGSVVCKIHMARHAEYTYWMKKHTPTEKELESQRGFEFEYKPLFSVVVPLYNTPERYLRDMVESVLAQTYQNWELCLADGSSEVNDIASIIQGYGDERIKYKKLEKNYGIAGNSNEAIKMATGDYVGLLDHDDTLMPHALFENVKLINADPDFEFIYCDEDKLSEGGNLRFFPFFKPDFSPNMLYAFNYITHFAVFKKTLLDEIGYFSDQYNGAQDYDLILRATEKAKKVGHISDILYNWRVSETSTAFDSESKKYTTDAGKAAIEAALKRRKIDAEVKPLQWDNYFNVEYKIATPQPLISILIPSHNEAETLKRCIDSIIKKTTWDNYEIVVVENNSTDEETFAYYKILEKQPKVRVVTWNHPFNFAAVNNFAVSQAKGEVLLFLNNDTSIISPDWLEQMAMHALRPDVGAVGAKLYYPDDTLQHGGIILRIGGVAGHAHKTVYRTDMGSFARLQIVHDLSAVTAACMMTRRDVFEEVEGFDETFVLAFNDVDFCLKVREKGYSVLWTPFAELYHYESKTRGYEDTPDKVNRFNGECRRWLLKWMEKYPVDPFYNKNLTQRHENFAINVDEDWTDIAVAAKRKKIDEYETMNDIIADVKAELEERKMKGNTKVNS